VDVTSTRTLVMGDPPVKREVPYSINIVTKKP
jgi:hypothetical protein